LRIGILTFHRCINYGSYWQARCLADGLRARGHEVAILDHASRRVDIAEWRCAFRPTLPVPTPLEDRPRYRAKIRRFFEAFEELPTTPRFPLDDPARAPAFDLVLVGSDEVWNLVHPWYAQQPLFFGDGLRAPRLASYAASFGNYNPWWGLEPQWAQRLRRFDAISVRDHASQAVVENATGTRPELVLDPCLQFPAEDRGPDAAGADDGDLAWSRRGYVAVYGHGFSPALVQRLRSWARRRGLALVSIGYRNDWADHQWLEAGPHQFAAFMAGADAVVTNFFHGCVFALRHHKPFACEESPYRSNKVRALMATVGGEPHLLAAGDGAGDLDVLLGAPLDPAIEAHIAAMRLRSARYLDRACAEPALA
jgi:hypothetical protein